MNGGASGYGVAFKLDTTGTEKLLYSFTGGTDGGGPEAGLIRDSAGNFYGTTVRRRHIELWSSVQAGYERHGDGAVQLHRGSGRGETLCRSDPRLGRQSLRHYSATAAHRGYGVVFKLDTTGTETVLYSFTGGADGAIPLRRSGPRLGRQSLRHYLRRRHIGLRE